MEKLSIGWSRSLIKNISGKTETLNGANGMSDMAGVPRGYALERSAGSEIQLRTRGSS